MPRSNKKKSAPQFNTEFVTVNLTSDTKKLIPGWIKKNADHLDDLIVEVLQSGHKITFSFSQHNDSFICSMTGKGEECLNQDKCMTSHAKDYSTALWVALYKYHEVFKRGVWESVDDEEDFG